MDLPAPAGPSMATITLCDGVEQLEEPGEAHSDRLRVLDVDSIAGDEPCHGAEHGDRWSPCEAIRPPLRRVGTPLTPEAVRRRGVTRTPRARSEFVTVSMRSVSFTRSSSAPQTVSRPAPRGRKREQRQLVDQQRHLRGGDGRRGELGRMHLEIPDRLAAAAVPVKDGDAGAHPREHLEQPDAPRVEADVVDRQLGSGQQRRRDDEGRRSGEVAGTSSRPARDPRPARPRPGAAAALTCTPAASASARCGHASARLDDRRRPGRVQPREEDADFTCALATGSA